jgi:ABC-type dipeptide/oligopeptide/nickel transport system ATPase component
MRIAESHIKSFRSVKDLQFQVQPLQALIGESNSGKSNILDALELYLSESLEGIAEHTFHDPAAPIELAITLSGLTDREGGRCRGYVRGDLLTLALTVGRDDDEGKPAGGDYHGMLREPRAEHLQESSRRANSTTGARRTCRGS